MTNTEMALEYYKAGAMQTGRGPWPKPKYIPKRIQLTQVVESEMMPYVDRARAMPGEYDAYVNPLGAVSIDPGDGKLLGVKLHEFEVISWVENPHAS